MRRVNGWGAVIALCSAVALHRGQAEANPRVALVTPSVDPVAATTRSATPVVPEPRRHAIYLEAFGKGGLWGLGYDLRIRRWIGVGAVASAAMLDGQRMLSLTPYVTLYPLGRGHHRWFVDAGPQLIRLTTPSPVPEWKGSSSTGIGGELSTGYEYRDRWLFRAFGMVAAGRGGIIPWFGMSIGRTL